METVRLACDMLPASMTLDDDNALTSPDVDACLLLVFDADFILPLRPDVDKPSLRMLDVERPLPKPVSGGALAMCAIWVVSVREL